MNPFGSRRQERAAEAVGVSLIGGIFAAGFVLVVALTLVMLGLLYRL